MTTQRTRRAHRPVDDLTRAKIQDAAREGKSRNAVAREFSVSGETVTRICAEVGITFDRTMTESAVRARTIDLAAERTILAQQMVAEAQEEMDLLNAPYLVWSFGGMDGELHSHLLDSAPMDVRNTAMRSAAIAFDKSSRLVENSGDGADSAKSMLTQLGRALGIGAEPVDNPTE